MMRNNMKNSLVQMMTASQFDDIASRQCKIDESSSQVFPYYELAKLSHKLLNKNYEHDGDYVSETYMAIRDTWLCKHSPPIRYCAGYGSSRAAFAMDGGKCLKVATNIDGIHQMKNEIQNFNSGSKLACFPAMHAYDKLDGFSMIVDCCKTATRDDFYAFYGLPCNLAVGTIFQLVNDQMSFGKTRSYFQRCLVDDDLAIADEYENFNARIKFLDNLEKLKDTSIQWKVMHDLCKFCYAHKSLGLYDLESEANWGIAVRDGEQCPIVIDAGLA